MVANLALFSEIANQFANIRFGDIVKVPVTPTVFSQNVMICIVLQYASGGRKVHKSMLILCFLVVFYFK